MSFMTLEPHLATERNFETSVNLMARYSSANTERTGHLDITLSGKNFASVTSFSNSWFDDLRIGGFIAAAMLINLITAAVAGFSVPLLLRRFGMDPALGGSDGRPLFDGLVEALS